MKEKTFKTKEEYDIFQVECMSKLLRKCREQADEFLLSFSDIDNAIWIDDTGIDEWDSVLEACKLVEWFTSTSPYETAYDSAYALCNEIGNSYSGFMKERSRLHLVEIVKRNIDKKLRERHE